MLLPKDKYSMVDPNKSASRQNLAHPYVCYDRAVELCSLPRHRLRRWLNLKPPPASKSPRLPDKKVPNPDIGATSPKPYRKLPKIIAARRLLWGRHSADKETDMRFISVALALAIGTCSAFAQSMRDTGSGGKGRNAAQNAEQQKIDEEKKKAAEDAYKAALKSIPDSKVKDDPWRGVR